MFYTFQELTKQKDRSCMKVFLLMLGGVPEIFPEGIWLLHSVVDELPGRLVIRSTVAASGVPWPRPCTWCALDERERSARNVWASGLLARISGQIVDLGLPPRPHFAFSSVLVGPLEQHAGDADNSSWVATEISFRFSPSISVLNDEPVASKSGANRDRVPNGNAQKPRGQDDI